jgi:putative hydrolase of the HAD superfamily
MADLKHKKHLFFDFDDTLWDFRKNSTMALNELFVEYELEQKLNTGFENFLQTFRRINLEFWSRYYKKQIDKHYLRNQRFTDTFKQFGYSSPDDNLALATQYLSRAPKGSFLKENCIEVLDYLKKNYKLHIITNGFKESQHVKIDGANLRGYFDQIIISDEHGLIKPEEAIFRLAEKLAGASRHECVMIGDSLESDIEGALNAGWEAIYFSEKVENDFNGRMIKDLSELKMLF